MNIGNTEMYQDIGLNEIPADWEVKNINKVAILNPDSLSSQTNGDLLIQYVDIESVSEGKVNNYKPFLFKDAPSRARRKVVEKDVIISTVRPYLKAFTMIKDIKPNTICSTGFAVLRAIEGVSTPEYLYHFISSDIFLNQLLSKMVGSNYPAVNTSEFGKTIIAMPHLLNEQQKISEILSAIDNDIQKTEQLIDKYMKIKQGLIQDLFTRGIQSDGKLRPSYEEAPDLYNESELGYIPKEWEVDTLYNVRDERDRHSFTGGPFGSDLKSEHYVDKGVRIIQLQNIGDGEFLDDYKIYTTENKANELINCNIYPNEIIIAKMADPLARACLIPDQNERYLMASDGIRLKVDKNKFNNYYILNVINFNEFRKRAIEKGTGTTRLRIGLNELRNIKIKIPSLEEQNRIASILENIDNKIKTEKQYVTKLELWKQGLMQDLLTGKVRVKVKGNEDE